MMTGTQLQATSTPSPSSSPLRSSPLANEPIFPHAPSPSPSPSPSASSSTGARALPIPQRRTSQNQSQRRTSMSLSPIIPSFSSSSPGSVLVSTSPPLPRSRSGSLLGSYPLSLIHSRMSLAHQPHSSSTGFSLHLKAVGQGRTCPPELRGPKPLCFPFAATYYDLEESGGPSQTPWVGTIDLEDYYHDIYSSSSSCSNSNLSSKSSSMIEMDPPLYPGYQIAPVGQLQMIVKTTTNAIKVFVIPYDLRHLSVGGRLLARERTYIQNSNPSSKYTSSSSPANIDVKGKKKESLRYAYQLQFICLPHPATTKSRGSSTTRKTSTSTSPPDEGRAYYLSRSLRVIFTSTPPEIDQEVRVERTDEVVPPSTSTSASTSVPGVNGDKHRRRSSVSLSSPGKVMREDWLMVRKKWLARRQITDVDVDVRVEESALDMTDHVEPHITSTESAPTVPLGSTLPPMKSPSRPTTPIPQPFNLPNSPSTPRVQNVTSPRFQRRHLRRTSSTERELSEKLRQLKMGPE